MRFSRFFALAFCGLLSLAAGAQQQLGVYVLATGQHMTSIKWDYVQPQPPNPFLTSNGPYTGKFSPLGYTIGSYYDFLSLGRFQLGVDARFVSTSAKKGTLANSTDASGAPYNGFIGPNARIYSGLGGVRGSGTFKISAVKIKPYLQASAGLVRTNYGVLYPDPPTQPGSTGRYSNLGIFGIGGADVTIFPALALRFEGGSGIVHGGPVSGTYPLQTFSAGVVFRFNRDSGR